MVTKTFSNSLTGAAFSAILFLVLIGTSAAGANAQQSSQVTITKDFCASIGATNTCNGIPASFPALVIFHVEIGTYNVATGVFTTTSTVTDVDVEIQQNANGSTTTAGFTADTYVRVCEVVPDQWTAIPRPESSAGGAEQYSEGNCLIARLGPGNNSLKFINGPSTGGPTAGEGSIIGRVVNSKGAGVSNARLTLVNAETGETVMGITNAFGFYTIDNLAVGDVFILSIAHKSYRFAEPSRTFTLSDSLTDVDFVAARK